MSSMLVLASQSPRRKEILQQAGLSFLVRVAPVVEVRAHGEPAADYVRRLAEAKARAVSSRPGEVVLGADTTVVLGDDIVLEKPADHADARRMLELLSGQSHRVLTGICLRKGERAVVDVESTVVRFLSLSDQEIDEYVTSGEPMDKAGGYAIQGLASKFIDRVEGCYFNVVGLPISLVYRRLKELQ
jgi:septum formation protein